MTAPAVTLAEYSDTELCEWYGASDPAASEWRQQMGAEMNRRDRSERARNARSAPPLEEWQLMAHAQYLEAERVCNGELVDPRYRSRVPDPFRLWSHLPDDVAKRYASEELRNYWLKSPRISITEYKRQAAGEYRAWQDRGAIAEAGEDMQVTDDTEAKARALINATVTSYGSNPAAELSARADRIRAQRAASQALAEDPDMAEAFTPAGDERPSAAALAVRDGRVLTRLDEWAEQVAAESVRYMERVLTRHVSWPNQAALDTVMLWLFHANARDRDETGNGPLIWRASPRLLLTSKERGSGKSTALDLVAILAGSRFGRMPRVTAPAFAKLMSKFQEAAILDEAKMIFGNGQKSLDLQGMLLAGYTQGTHSLTAHNGGTADKLFGAVAYAGKDNLITTASDGVADLLDRSLVIRMRRPNRHYPDIDETAEEAARLAQQGMARWASAMKPGLVAASRRLSREAAESGEVSAEDVASGVLRQAQIRRPLIACADVLGGDWPERARAAAAAGDSETEDWLADLRGLDAALWDDGE